MNFFINKLPITRIKLWIARVLFHLIKPFYGTEKRIVKRNGIYFEIDLTEGLDLSLFLFGNFQKHVSDNKFISLKNNAVVLDVGANVGIMSLHFAKRIAEGRVYAFEPTHYAYHKLNRNMMLNPELAKRILPIQTFVSSIKNKDMDIQAFSSWKIDKKVGSDQHPIHGGAAMSTEGVPTTTIDEFVQTQKIDTIDFIKIDTDGHEYEVLLGAEQTIKSFNPQIIFELGLYVMEEKGINFMDYWHYFEVLKYSLTDAATNKLITKENFKNKIPRKGTIDVLAIYRP